jgi:sugar phosphate isomerase/epimerase
MPRAQAVRLFHQGLERVIPTAEELGVKLLVEPEPGLMIERTAEFLDLIKEVRSPVVGLNFDIGHFYCVGEDPARALEALFRWVGHVHVEDIAASREHNHLIAGRGAIDFAAVFQTMAGLVYRHDMTLELYPYLDRPEEAGRESLEHLLPLLVDSGLLDAGADR